MSPIRVGLCIYNFGPAGSLSSFVTWLRPTFSTFREKESTLSLKQAFSEGFPANFCFAVPEIRKHMKTTEETDRLIYLENFILFVRF